MAADPALVSPTSPRAAASGQVNAFFAWWKSEILAAIPPEWRDRLAGSAAGMPIAMLPDAFITLGLKDGKWREVARLPLAGMETAAQAVALQRLIEDNGGRTERAILALPSGTFVTRIIELPLAAEEAVAQVVGFELDRHTPFRAAQACFAVRVLGRTPNGAGIRVQLVAAPRETVEKLLAQAERMGVHAAAVIPWDEQAADLPSRSFNLLPQDGRSAPGWSAETKLAASLGAVFAVALLAALLLPIWQKREEVLAILPQLNNAKMESEKVQKTRNELERLVSDSNYILGRKHAQVPMTALIEDLAKSFPDTTWVAALEVKAGKQRELILTGETASATKVLELLEQLPYLKNPAFRSQLTKVPGQIAEKFVIGAEIKLRPLPAMQEPPLAPNIPAAPGGTAPASGSMVNPASPAASSGTLPGVSPAQPATPAGPSAMPPPKPTPTSAGSPPVQAPVTAPKSDSAKPDPIKSDAAKANVQPQAAKPGETGTKSAPAPASAPATAPVAAPAQDAAKVKP